MRYKVREDLHFCHTGEQMVFLDLRDDRYFLLQGDLEQAFAAHVSGTKEEAPDRLVELGLLVEGNGQAELATQALATPTRSAFELDQARRKVSIWTVLEVALLVFLTKRSLATRKIQEVLDDHMSGHRALYSKADAGACNALENKLLAAVADFMQARRLVPIDASCLLDSLALYAFLQRRQLCSTLVFGVTLDPFSAHAWLQRGDLVLNDSVSHAGMHTPILVL